MFDPSTNYCKRCICMQEHCIGQQSHLLSSALPRIRERPHIDGGQRRAKREEARACRDSEQEGAQNAHRPQPSTTTKHAAL